MSDLSGVAAATESTAKCLSPFSAGQYFTASRDPQSPDGRERQLQNRNNALFIQACSRASIALEARFPTEEVVLESDALLGEERMKLDEIMDTLSHVNNLLQLLLTHRDHAPVTWSSMDEAGGRAVHVQRSWHRHGMYEAASSDVECCIARLAAAGNNLCVDSRRQVAVSNVETSRRALAAHFFSQPENLSGA